MLADREPVWLRVAPHGAAVVVDLNREDGATVVIGPGASSVVPRSPVLFRRTRAMSAMPLPAEIGNLDALKDLLNITEESWRLVIGWLVGSLMPELALAILLFLGGQGSAKSTAGRLAGGLVDPSRPSCGGRRPMSGTGWRKHQRPTQSSSTT